MTASGWVTSSASHAYSPPGVYQVTFQVVTSANGPTTPANAWTVTVTTLPVSVTIATSPPGLGITADGTAYASPHTFSWIPGSQHTVATTATQGNSSTQYVFANWSDSGAVSHVITVPPAGATYTANFITQYYLTTSASAGGSISPASGWQNAGTVQVSAAPAGGYTFTGSGGALSGTTTPQTLTLSSAATVTASFAVLPTTTISTFPVGLSVTVDGTSAACNPYCSFQWVPGSPHSIGASNQPGTTGTQWLWASWSDGGAASHGVTASSSGGGYTASFNPQYYFTSSVSPAGTGTIAPGSGWYNAGASFWATASPSVGYQLSSFTPGGAVPSYDVVMNGPVTLIANFVAFSGQTITSNPPGASFTVDNAGCSSPCTFYWTPGTQHTIATTSAQSLGNNTHLVFASWSDGSSGSSDTITAAAGTTYTENFTAQYQLTTAVNPAGDGSVSPASGWYNAGTPVTLTPE